MQEQGGHSLNRNNNVFGNRRRVDSSQEAKAPKVKALNLEPCIEKNKNYDAEKMMDAMRKLESKDDEKPAVLVERGGVFDKIAQDADAFGQEIKTMWTAQKRYSEANPPRDAFKTPGNSRYQRHSIAAIGVCSSGPAQKPAINEGQSFIVDQRPAEVRP